MDLHNIVSLLVVFGFAWLAAFFQLPSIAWTILIGVLLLVLTLAGYLSSFILLIVLWILYIAAASFANLHKLRQRYLVQPALKKLKAQLPTISKTEREAIEAGNTWWEKELFSGYPHWKTLLSTAQPILSKEEQDFLNHQVDHLCSLLNDWNIVFKDHDLPEEVWNYLKKEKFFGMAIPKQYGGLGFSALAHSTVVVKIATRSGSAAVTTMVPNSLGPAELLLHYGTDEQKNYYLPRLADGIEIPCFALTAPEAGSDAGAMPDTGIVCRDEYEGKETIGIRLNWDKRYITLAPVATILGLAFHLYDPDHLLGAVEDIGITLCLLPTSHPGVEVGSRHLPIYQSFMNGPTRGKDIFIPLDWIIGGPKMAGQGWRMLMECLSIGRSISLPALATATSKMAYRYTGAYARIRKQFNVPIASFEGIEEALGQIAGRMYLIESARIMTAGAVDQHIKPAIASAIVKYHLTEMSRIVMSSAMDIHAGHAVQVGPRNFLANAYLCVPISITVEGANILTRNLIIFGQGAIRCHPYILKEVELISAAEPNVAAVDQTLMSHIGFLIRNFAQSFAYGLSGGCFILTNFKHKQVKKRQRQLTRMSSALALLADVSLITLGGSLKRRERISARLGDIMSQLYLASAALKYFKDHAQPDTDVDSVCFSIDLCLSKIQQSCDDLLDNYPNRFLGSILQGIIFPFGPAYRAPKDILCKRAVEAMLTPSGLRDRLTQYCYLSDQENDITYRLDKALAAVTTIDPIWKKLHKAVQSGMIPHYYDLHKRIEAAQSANILSAEEATQLKEFESLKNEVIKVNEFSFDLNTVIA